MTTCTPESTEIFSYSLPSGERVNVDPMRVRRKMSHATQGHYDELVNLALAQWEEEKEVRDPMTREPVVDPVTQKVVTEIVRVPDADKIAWQAMDAMGKLIPAAAFGFDLKLFDGTDGFTEDFVWALLLSFDDWLQKKRTTSGAN